MVSKFSRYLFISGILLFCFFVRAEESLHLPAGEHAVPDQLLKRSGFSIGYSKKLRQPIWVCYILSAGQLQLPRLRRTNKFVPDPDIIFNPVKPGDYNKSGYDRGHLAPAADMSYAELPLKHSFYMSNISPQLPGCNRGIWKRLENQARQWALQEQRLCIITGPLFDRSKPAGELNGIPVPNGFFKIVLDLTPPCKMAAFIIPNDSSKKRLRYFSVTVEEVERLTGFKFFTSFPDSKALKGRNDFDRWQKNNAAQ